MCYVGRFICGCVLHLTRDCMRVVAQMCGMGVIGLMCGHVWACLLIVCLHNRQFCVVLITCRLGDRVGVFTNIIWY